MAERGQREGSSGARRSPPAGGELALIERIRRLAARTGPRRRGELQLGIGDDCAILRPGRGEEIVVTTDFSLEGRHFRRDWHSPASVGHRALARGLSDLAAMGARPVAAFLSLALPPSVARDKAWVDGFLRGLFALAKRTGVPLAGGDTAEAPGEHILADIVLLGAVAQRRALRRDGATPGDRLFVTGTLGGSAAQLRGLAQGERALRVGRSQPHPHFFPQPRLGAGRWLVQHRRATAAIDLSDGLSTDLHQLCDSSDVGAEVITARLPFDPRLTGLDAETALALALHGGEDYELLFTAGPEARVPRRIGGVPVAEIGRIVARRRARPRVVLVDAEGRSTALVAAGWEHLR